LSMLLWWFCQASLCWVYCCRSFGQLLRTCYRIVHNCNYYYYYIVVVVVVVVVVVSRHKPFLPGTSLEPTVILTARTSSFRLQYFPYYVWCSWYSCLCSEAIECFPGMASRFFLKPLLLFRWLQFLLVVVVVIVIINQHGVLHKLWICWILNVFWRWSAIFTTRVRRLPKKCRWPFVWSVASWSVAGWTYVKLCTF